MEGNFILFVLIIFPMAAGLVCWGLGEKREKAAMNTAGIAVIIQMLLMGYLLAMFIVSDGLIKGAPVGKENLTGYVVYFQIPGFCGMGLNFTLDGFRTLYGTIACFMWMISTLFGREYFHGNSDRKSKEISHSYRRMNRYYFFLLLTLGATMGVFLSADLFTTFLFFELMSLSSYAWVAHDEKKESLQAGDTYMAVAMIGGLVMLMGIFLLYQQAGTLSIDQLYEICRKALRGEGGPDPAVLYAAGTCLLFGFGAKAGAFPLHIWLPKAHPVAPAPASGLLSGILTKAGIFGVLVISCNLFLYDPKWGTFLLLIGIMTMLTGAILALFSVNIKRIFACSSVSQIGFILVGIGMQGLLGVHNSLAVRGTLLHMVNHSLFKLILFMAAGVVYMNLHKLDLNEIRGFGRKKPMLNFIFLMGALGISGIPLWSGYVSKTLIHESIVEYMKELQLGNYSDLLLGAAQMRGIELLFLLSGGITVAYMLKVYIAIFIEKNSDMEKQHDFDNIGRQYLNPLSRILLGFSALLIPFMGFLPRLVMDQIAALGEVFMHPEHGVEEVAYFSLGNLKGSLVSIAIGILLYLVVVRKWMMGHREEKEVYLDKWNPYWDLERVIYRPILLRILPGIFGFLSRVCDSLVDSMVVLLRKTIYRDSKLPHELEEGNIFTHLFGVLADRFIHLMNKTFWYKKKRKEGAEHWLVLRHEKVSEDNTIIGRSLSFGLLLFCGGLVLTILYLLLN